VPALPDGSAARWLALVGAAGSALWPHFTASPQYADGARDPLDRWSRAIGDSLAAQMGGIALYPFGGPPHHPFQRWAERAEGLHASPLGLRLHPHYGLWHSYRFALALPSVLDEQEPLDDTDLCAHCSGQPCLSACPVDAFTGSAYRVDVCAAHLATTPEARCAGVGCLARHACPVGQQHAQQPEHARFLMDAFRAAQTTTRR
jgi:ferredoxin